MNNEGMMDGEGLSAIKQLVGTLEIMGKFTTYQLVQDSATIHNN